MYDPMVKQADENKKSPSGCYGGGGHTKTLPGANVYTQTHPGRRVLVVEAAGQICLQAGNTNRRQQLQGSGDSLEHPLMNPATEGGEQWPMRRVLPTKPIVHAPMTLWPCSYLCNGVVLSFWIV